MILQSIILYYVATSLVRPAATYARSQTRLAMTQAMKYRTCIKFRG